jgi:3-methyl-2-oxobutanoate hydroxymethyltransferase
MKCEGNRYHAPNIEAIVRSGIPVQGHIGITPMRMPQLGGFVAQGKTAKRAKEMIEDAKAMVDAGCFSILCEVTTSEVAEYLAQTLPVPVIRALEQVIARTAFTSFLPISSIFGKSTYPAIRASTPI